MSAGARDWRTAARALVSKRVVAASLPLVLATSSLALLSASMWHDGTTYIEEVSSTLMGIRRLVAGDSEHYLAIADSLRQGDFRMEHVEPTGAADRAHRQPGFPALLALSARLGVQGAPGFARVNLAVLVASLWIAFVGAGIATGSSMAALLAAVVVYDVHFLFGIATGRLLTEPLYVAVALAAVGSSLCYLARPRNASLFGVAVFSGLAYLVRVNGLFLAIALAAVVVVDGLRRRRAAPAVHAQDAPRVPFAAHAVAIALFVLFTTPSWLPRAIYAGNPVYHGYLANFLWVDDYARAHQPGPPRYSLETYMAEHGAVDAASRLAWGMQHVFWETPRQKFGTVVSVALLAAVVILVLLGDTPGMLLTVAGVVQAMPLAWTAVADPAHRLPATALLPFAAFVIAAATAALLRRAHASASGTRAADAT